MNASVADDHELSSDRSASTIARSWSEDLSAVDADGTLSEADSRGLVPARGNGRRARRSDRFALGVDDLPGGGGGGGLAGGISEGGDRHARLLLASLLENFCRLYESEPVRSERLFGALCGTLRSMGVLDHENVDELAGVRSAYSRAFRQLMARAREAVDREALPALQSGLSAGGPSAGEETKALVPLALGDREARGEVQIGDIASASLDDWLGLEDSRYRNEWVEIGQLGRGGFGAVYRARNRIDDRDYAVKRVHLGHTRRSHVKVFREIKTLARLEHPNVVRYFSSWLEHARPSKRAKRPADRRSVFVGEHSRVNRRADRRADLVFAFAPDVTSDRDDSAVVFAEDSAIVFQDDGHDSGSDSDHASKSTARSYRESRRKSSSTTESLSRPSHTRASMDARSELSSSVEQITRSIDVDLDVDLDNPFSASLPSYDRFNRPRRRRRPRRASDFPEAHALTLYIQMHLCQSTLRDLLRARDASEACRLSDSRSGDVAAKRPARTVELQLLRAIMDGVAYVHREGLCHRDLKPTNIFLAEAVEGEPGAVDLTELIAANAPIADTDAGAADRVLKRRYVVPKLGDFGLALPDQLLSGGGACGELEKDDVDTAPPTTAGIGQFGSEDEDDSERHGVGTATYAAPEQLLSPSLRPSSSRRRRGTRGQSHCEGADEEGDVRAAAWPSYTTKCDVYALGVILFELLHARLNVVSGSRMERASLLGDLRHAGVLPERVLVEHPAEAALCLAMCHIDPAERPGVREVLESGVLHLAADLRDAAAAKTASEVAAARVSKGEAGQHGNDAALRMENDALRRRVAELERSLSEASVRSTPASLS